jgi:hypothetical protein
MAGKCQAASSADYHLLFFLSIRRTPAVEICLWNCDWGWHMGVQDTVVVAVLASASPPGASDLVNGKLTKNKQDLLAKKSWTGPEKLD